MAFLGVQNFTDSDNVANSILKVHVTELLKCVAEIHISNIYLKKKNSTSKFHLLNPTPNSHK